MAYNKYHSRYYLWGKDIPVFILAHDKEHTWRSRGEFAIREEMERKLVSYFTKKNLRKVG